jgi:multidrug efflux pump subunit AcrB
VEYAALLIAILLIFALWALPFRAFKWAFGICLTVPLAIGALAFLPYEQCRGDGCIGNGIVLLGMLLFAATVLFGGITRLIYRWLKMRRR